MFLYGLKYNSERISNMNIIGIIAAMQEEFEQIKKIMNSTKKKIIKDITFLEGMIGNRQIILVLCGVGKVNAARTTQILIDYFNIDTIINIGSSGALNPELNIGDIVIADKLIQHDFDITAFGHNKGYITGVGEYIYSDKKMVKDISNIINNISQKKYKVKIGTIATGDIFCTDIEMKNKIYKKFNAQCVEMEGAAIAQVSYLNKIPFIVIRSISDTPNGNNNIVFEKFIKLASIRCAELLQKYLNN